jgi:hypothetical protein
MAAERRRRLRLIDTAAAIGILAIAFAVLMPWAAVIFTVTLLIMCVLMALGRATFAELLVMSAILLPLFWLLSAAVMAAREVA